VKKHLQDIRDLIIYESWEKYKNQLTMEDLAGFFNISLQSTYRIVSYLENKQNEQGAIQVKYDLKGRKKITK